MALDSLMPHRATSAYSDSLSRTTPSPNTSSPVDETASVQPSASSADTARPGAIISLSPDALVLARALSIAQATPDLRPDRIAAAQAHISAGDSQIDPYRLAGALLGSSGE